MRATARRLTRGERNLDELAAADRRGERLVERGPGRDARVLPAVRERELLEPRRVRRVEHAVHRLASRRRRRPRVRRRSCRRRRCRRSPGCAARASVGGSSSAPTSCSRARSPSSTRVTPGRARRPGWRARCRVAVAIVPSMPARPRLACTGTFLPPSTRVGDAHEPRRAEHEPVVRPGGAPDRVDERSAIERRADRGQSRPAIAPSRSAGTADASPSASGAGGARSTDAARDACSHAPSHSRSASPAATATASTAVVTPLRFSGSPGPAHGEHLDLGVGQQRRGLAAERRVARARSTRSTRPPSSGSASSAR